MSFFLKKNKDSAIIADIVSKIAVATGVEKNVIYHFIAVDLEKIHQEKINVHSTRLKTLEDEFGTLQEKENTLKEQASAKKKDSEKLAANIESLTKLLNERIALVALKSQEVAGLQLKLKDIDANLKSIETDKSKMAYQLMMKNHSVKEKTSLPFKKITWILTGFTVIGIILAIIYILISRK